MLLSLDGADGAAIAATAAMLGEKLFMFVRGQVYEAGWQASSCGDGPETGVCLNVLARTIAMTWV